MQVCDEAESRVQVCIRCIAEALPRLRGLKFRHACMLALHVLDCRGIAPTEGTEMRIRVTER